MSPLSGREILWVETGVLGAGCRLHGFATAPGQSVLSSASICLAVRRAPILGTDFRRAAFSAAMPTGAPADATAGAAGR